MMTGVVNSAVHSPNESEQHMRSEQRTSHEAAQQCFLLEVPTKRR